MSIGILLPHCGQSQPAFLMINHVNTLLLNGSKDDFCFFYHEVMPLQAKPLCAMMNSSEIWGFEGNLISTTLLDADRILKVQHAKKRILYLSDLEWANGIDHTWAGEILINPKLKVIARSHNHANEIQKYCGISPTVVQNFNIGQINGYQ